MTTVEILEEQMSACNEDSGYTVLVTWTARTLSRIIRQSSCTKFKFSPDENKYLK